MDNLDFLDGDSPAETAAVPAAETAPASEPVAEGPARGPDGKFAAKASDPAPEPAPQPAHVAAAPAPVEAPPPAHVPITALMDERDKRRALEEQLRQIQQQRPQERPQVPDMFEDPEGYQGYQASQVDQARWDAITSVSEVMAADKYGAERVKEATDAFVAELQSKPWLQAELRQQRHPYAWVVERHQREQIAASVNPNDFAEFQAWKQAQAQIAAAPVAVHQLAPTPPRSQAAMPNAGGAKPGEQPVGPGIAFEAIFAR